MRARRFLFVSRLLAFAGSTAIMLGAAVTTASAHGGGSFRTSQDAMLTAVPLGASVTPIITVGDALSSGYRFDSIPDGIAIDGSGERGDHGDRGDRARRITDGGGGDGGRGEGRVQLYINHETSLVPFPIATSAATWNPTNSTNGTQNDFTSASVSRLTLDRRSIGIVAGASAIPSSANYERFCSSFLATRENGFSRDLLLTNEETNDFVSRTGVPYPAPTSEPPSQQAGVVVAYDPETGQYRSILGMGRLNHENALAVAGYGHPVVLTGDDTFTSNPPQSQVYMYQARNARQVWKDEGTLYGFVSTTPGFDDYYDFTPGSAASVTGKFVALDPTAARGTQSALEADSNAKGVFHFVRIEDMAYDRTNPNIVYLADTGRATSGAPGPGKSTNGRIWKMALDPNDPTNVLSLSILVDGDTAAVKDPTAIHQPDNIETTRNGHLLITEDPGGNNQFASASDPDATTARIWMVDAATSVKSVVARVDQSLDGGSTDVDGFANGQLGQWESTGIVDASSVFGPGAFLVNVQAHTLWLQKQASGDNATWTGQFTPFTSGSDGQTDWMYKREGGQLLLLRIPGA